MAERRQGTTAASDRESQREARLKSALRANLARRKARARSIEETPGDPAHSPGGDTSPPPSEKD